MGAEKYLTKYGLQYVERRIMPRVTIGRVAKLAAKSQKIEGGLFEQDALVSGALVAAALLAGWRPNKSVVFPDLQTTVPVQNVGSAVQVYYMPVSLSVPPALPGDWELIDDWRAGEVYPPPSGQFEVSLSSTNGSYYPQWYPVAGQPMFSLLTGHPGYDASMSTYHRARMNAGVYEVLLDTYWWRPNTTSTVPHAGYSFYSYVPLVLSQSAKPVSAAYAADDQPSYAAWTPETTIKSYEVPLPQKGMVVPMPSPFDLPPLRAPGYVPGYLRPAVRVSYDPVKNSSAPAENFNALHAQMPPRRGTKEKKVSMKGYYPLMSAFGHLTELRDAVQAVYKALPKQNRIRYQTPLRPGFRPNFKPLKDTTTKEMLVHLYQNWHLIDGPTAAKNIAFENLQDLAIGVLGKKVKKRSQELRPHGRLPIGFQFRGGFAKAAYDLMKELQ